MIRYCQGNSAPLSALLAVQPLNHDLTPRQSLCRPKPLVVAARPSAGRCQALAPCTWSCHSAQWSWCISPAKVDLRKGFLLNPLESAPWHWVSGKTTLILRKMHAGGGGEIKVINLHLFLLVITSIAFQMFLLYAKLLHLLSGICTKNIKFKLDLAILTANIHCTQNRRHALFYVLPYAVYLLLTLLLNTGDPLTVVETWDQLSHTRQVLYNWVIISNPLQVLLHVIQDSISCSLYRLENEIWVKLNNLTKTSI